MALQAGYFEQPQKLIPGVCAFSGGSQNHSGSAGRTEFGAGGSEIRRLFFGCGTVAAGGDRGPGLLVFQQPNMLTGGLEYRTFQGLENFLASRPPKAEAEAACARKQRAEREANR